MESYLHGTRCLQPQGQATEHGRETSCDGLKRREEWLRLTALTRGIIYRRARRSARTSENATSAGRARVSAPAPAYVYARFASGCREEEDARWNAGTGARRGPLRSDTRPLAARHPGTRVPALCLELVVHILNTAAADALTTCIGSPMDCNTGRRTHAQTHGARLRVAKVSEHRGFPP